MSVPIMKRDGSELFRIRISDRGKVVSEILEVLRDEGLIGTLEAGGVRLTASDVVYPQDMIVFVPGRSRSHSGDSSALPRFMTPVLVKPSKRQKVCELREAAVSSSVQELVGNDNVDALAALNWLWLHLSDESSVNLTTFLTSTHEKRYYPYVYAVLRAAAAGGLKRVEVLDKNKAIVPDVQVVIDGGKEVVPIDVKKVWGHGSVDDPDGISRNAEVLEQMLNQVLMCNKQKAADYRCVAAVIIRVQYVLFLRFHIRKPDADALGSLARLEYAPKFPRGGDGKSGLTEVRLIHMEDLINEHFGLDKKWSGESLDNMGLPDRTVARMQRTTLRELLPVNPPEGFHSLVKYFRTVAPSCYDHLRFVYDSQEGEVQVAQVLASGPKSCVVATAEGSSVLKISSEEYMTLDFRGHKLVDPLGGPFLRKMVARGHVEGAAPGLVFIELEGLGVPWSIKHVWDEDGVVRCWEQASIAVKALHAQKVFHRDIKPDNFIVLDHNMGSQRLVLNDLDCASHWDRSMTEDVGTQKFKSPMLVEGEDYCCRDDWLSLGLSFASLMGIYDAQKLSPQVKLSSLQVLTRHAHVPQDMKQTIQLALHCKHVCCHRVVACALAEYDGDRMLYESCQFCSEIGE